MVYSILHGHFFLSFNWRNLFEIITILSTIKIRWKMVIIFLQSWSTGAFPFHVFLEKAFFSRRNSVTRWIQHLFPWGGRAAMSCNWALPSWLRLLTIFPWKRQTVTFHYYTVYNAGVGIVYSKLNTIPATERQIPKETVFEI